MTRTVLFDSPYLLGFDDMRDLIERIGRSHDNYPPYNVESLSPDHLRISIAVAGFTVDQLRVEVRGAHLTVTASKERGEAEARDYLHRGIALRGFKPRLCPQRWTGRDESGAELRLAAYRPATARAQRRHAHCPRSRWHNTSEGEA
ncbi:MAG: Hsp20 family protein [Asticcacaulis sp.]